MKPNLGAALCALCLLTAPLCAQEEPLAADGGFFGSVLADCKTDLRYLNQISGWQASWPRDWQAVAGADDGFDGAVTRWKPAPAALAAAEKSLRAGIDHGETAPRAVVLRVLQQVRDLSAGLAARDPRYFTADGNGRGWNDLLADELAPAIGAYAAFLETEYLPAARATPGLIDIENGEACYANAVTEWTTLTLGRDEIEAIGERLLDDARAELIATGEKGDTLQTIMARLRAGQAADATTKEELVVVSQAALDRAQDEILPAFSKKAPHRIVVTELPAHLQASAPAGFYRPPEGDGPARYVINPSRPGERRLMAEVIAFHEGVPGHHLFFDYPRDTPSEGYNSGLLEGWALYAEYVADELGLFSTQFDRQGMITKHLWAASRLVVEPGLHLRGWSREDAISFMLENTVMSREEIEIEVDRYIAMPGQSLSYMLGADLLLSERERARENMGDAFDIRAFHDVVLAPGVRSLPDVRADIRRWAGAG